MNIRLLCYFDTLFLCHLVSLPLCYFVTLLMNIRFSGFVTLVVWNDISNAFSSLSSCNREVSFHFDAANYFLYKSFYFLLLSLVSLLMLHFGLYALCISYSRSIRCSLVENKMLEKKGTNCTVIGLQGEAKEEAEGS